MSLTDRSISRSVAGGNSVDFSEKRNGYGGSLYHRGHSDRVVERTLAKYEGGGKINPPKNGEYYTDKELYFMSPSERKEANKFNEGYTEIQTEIRDTNEYPEITNKGREYVDRFRDGVGNTLSGVRNYLIGEPQPVADGISEDPNHPMNSVVQREFISQPKVNEVLNEQDVVEESPKQSSKKKGDDYEYRIGPNGELQTKKKVNKTWITPDPTSVAGIAIAKKLGVSPTEAKVAKTTPPVVVKKVQPELSDEEVMNLERGANSGSDELVKQKNTYKGLGNTLSDLGTAGVGLANYFSGRRALDDLDNIGHSPELNLNQAVNVEELSNEGDIQAMKSEGNRLVRAGLMSGNLNKESLSALAMSETQKNISRSNANMNNVNVGIRNQNRMNSQQVMGENLNAINNRDRENYNNDASRKIAQIQGRQRLSGQLTNHLTQTLAQANQRKLDDERMEIERSFDPYGTRQRREEEKQKKRDSQTWLQRNLWN